MSYSDLSNLVTFRPLERPVGSGPTRYSPFRASWSRWYEGRRYCRECNRNGGVGRQTTGTRPRQGALGR